jgi:hypothetical protein
MNFCRHVFLCDIFSKLAFLFYRIKLIHIYDFEQTVIASEKLNADLSQNQFNSIKAKVSRSEKRDIHTCSFIGI